MNPRVQSMLPSPSKLLYNNTTPTAYLWFTAMDNSRGGLAPSPAAVSLPSLMRPANIFSQSQLFDPNWSPLQHPRANYTINLLENPGILDPGHSFNSRHYCESKSDPPSPIPVRWVSKISGRPLLPTNPTLDHQLRTASPRIKNSTRV